MSASSRDEVIAALDGFDDPVSHYLRDAVTERGTLTGNYRDVLDGVGTITGCGADTENSFVVLSNVDYTPRPVLTRCADDPQAASQFLMVMAGVTEGHDIDPQVVHMVGWDDASGQYRRYSTYPNEDGELALNVSPTFCLGCHGGPEQLGYWQPLMNVMTNPWSGWNAEPGFRSHMFDENLDPRFSDGESFEEITAQLSSASDFEPIVRAGIDRVTGARIRARNDDATADAALALLRPVFCDEMVNFVSEVHDSGELRVSAAIDDAMRSLFSRAVPGAEYSWLGTTSLQLPVPGADETPLALIPIRGESNVQAELALVSRGVLSAEQLLRVRALDWTRPAQSQFRCTLFRTTAERVRAEGESYEGLSAGELAAMLFEEMMAPYPVPDGADVLAIADGFDPEDSEALTFDQLGTVIDAHVTALQMPGGRQLLDVERRRRACETAALYPIAPIFPDIDCD